MSKVNIMFIDDKKIKALNEWSFGLIVCCVIIFVSVGVTNIFRVDLEKRRALDLELISVDKQGNIVYNNKNYEFVKTGKRNK